MTPRLAFFPGASGAGEFWAPVADRLPRAWPSRLLSWPGAGAQPHDPTVRGYHDLVGYAAARISDGSDVIAQSMGGVIAIGLALTHPRKVRRLVLVATSGGLDVAAHGGQDWREEYHREFPTAAGWLTTERIDYTEQLHRVTVPTCLIWGDADPISPPAVGRALHRALRSAVLHVVAGGTHMLVRERPGELTTIITQHLR
jgi:pimeloyl-ACP methyl ester carboxylesterase